MKPLFFAMIVSIIFLSPCCIAEEKTASISVGLSSDDPYNWLEDVAGDKALTWVRERNAETAKELEESESFKTLQAIILKILVSDEKIPIVKKAGAYYYNFWRDALNSRGVSRRTTLEEYRKADPKWEKVLDDVKNRLYVLTPGKGGSNGGLLVGNMLIQYLHLQGAVVCSAPLLDMKRYSHLLAGASWMEEYGDPDKSDEWEYIKTFSPYQLVKSGAKYPPVLFMITTRDDRVHPSHARKMMANMRDLSYDVNYFENIEGGHGTAADNHQTSHLWALAFAFLQQKLK
ncbi:MAG: S9 family peptidase [Candidatus Riflebacteria bacterium]|nr:S9 family peptidase [Candidatus Riflebacteria bacterium]